MPNKPGTIVLYSKAASFELDRDDGTIHTILDTFGMEVRIIQTRSNFLRTGARADRFRKEVTSHEAEIVSLHGHGKDD